MHSRLRIPLMAVATLAAATLTVTILPTASAESGATTVTKNMEIFSPDGEITRSEVSIAVNDSPAPSATVNAAAVTPILENGPSAEKLDIVVVGDGYTSEELDTYAEHTRSKIDELFAVEPYKSYQDQFNVWMVDVVSNESGVDNDPQGTDRDTALDMYFYCGDIARLLCVNDTKANQYAAQAPEADQVLALANTTTYGGAGGGIATSAGGNDQSGQIVVHELAHSIGGLADEYTYGEGENYTGPEVGEVNVSIKDRATQESEQVKWYQWMGQETPDGGTIDVYDGARYWASGIYRPSDNSIMRELGREFNLPGREAMIAAFGEYAPSATTSLDTSAAVEADATLSVTLPRLPSGHRITWTIDGTELTGAANDTSLDLAKVTTASSGSRITVTVVDATDWVKDPDLVEHSLTSSFSWTVQ